MPTFTGPLSSGVAAEEVCCSCMQKVWIDRMVASTRAIVLMAVCLSLGKLDRRSLTAHILFYPAFLFKHYFRLNRELLFRAKNCRLSVIENTTEMPDQKILYAL